MMDSDFDMEYECKLNFILVAKIESETTMCRTTKHAVEIFRIVSERMVYNSNDHSHFREKQEKMSC